MVWKKNVLYGVIKQLQGLRDGNIDKMYKEDKTVDEMIICMVKSAFQEVKYYGCDTYVAENVWRLKDE